MNGHLCSRLGRQSDFVPFRGLMRNLHELRVAVR